MSVSSTSQSSIDASDLDCYRDAAWALRDPQVQIRFAGQWVVALRRQVIAHGTDAGDVLCQANSAAPNRNHRLVFCSGQNPDEDLTESPDEPLDFSHA